MRPHAPSVIPEKNRPPDEGCTGAQRPSATALEIATGIVSISFAIALLAAFCSADTCAKGERKGEKYLEKKSAS